MDVENDITIYSKDDGVEPFNEWLKTLADIKLQSVIFQRLQRIRLGNFGDCKPIDDSIWELRIHYSAGYRIYYSRTGKKIILLLCAGSKNTQKKDIRQAQNYLADYKRRTR